MDQMYSDPEIIIILTWNQHDCNILRATNFIRAKLGRDAAGVTSN
jgi:hypothetical protein